MGSSSSRAGLSWEESKPRLTAEVKPHRAVPPAWERRCLSSVAGCGCPCLPAGTHAWWFPPKTTSRVPRDLLGLRLAFPVCCAAAEPPARSQQLRREPRAPHLHPRGAAVGQRMWFLAVGLVPEG